MSPDIAFYFLLPFVLTIAICVAGVLLLSIAYRQKEKSGQVAVENWSIAGGKVLFMRLVNHQLEGSPTGGLQVKLLMEYVYTVADIEYRGSKIFAGFDGRLAPGAAQEVIEQYPLNSYIQVRYNPQDPSESAPEVQPGRASPVTIAGWLVTGFGLCACVFTVFVGLIVLGGIQ